MLEEVSGICKKSQIKARYVRDWLGEAQRSGLL
jgi:hypothetical protein